jgi:hypothetical protein
MFSIEAGSIGMGTFLKEALSQLKVISNGIYLKHLSRHLRFSL